MYSQFAVICGCESVVIPGEHANRADWGRENELGKFGIAYGLEQSELDHARATRDQLIELLRAKEETGLETVRQFVDLTRKRFRP